MYNKEMSVIESKPAPKALKTKESILDPETETIDSVEEDPCILEEIKIEELAIDGICGVY